MKIYKNNTEDKNNIYKFDLKFDFPKNVKKWMNVR